MPRGEYAERSEFWKSVDWSVALSVITLLAFGLLAIYSASNGIDNLSNFHKQVAWVLIGALAAIVIFYVPLRTFQDFAYLAYALSIVALILALFFARKVAGNAAWLQIGGASFQPSEIAKITTILALARFLSNKDNDIRQVKTFVIAIGIVALPCVLVLLQPDAGTALTYLTFVVPMIVVAGFDFYYVLLLGLPLACALLGFISLFGFLALEIFLAILMLALRRDWGWSIASLLSGAGLGIASNLYAAKILKPHQLKRIQTFLDPMSDPQGAGYNALQAKIAIGSGGLWGKGFLRGTQTQLRFIPAQWTDFIFCVIGEEFGFWGASLVIGAYLLLSLRWVRLAEKIKNRFAILVLTGFVSLLLGHVIINLGMTLGLLPVIGIPLPFLSYGGSSMLANMVAVGIALNFYKHRRDVSFS
ncbi:MAG: rod shape-determining protein RodA [Chloroherpetonaceae bacterium]|nr:rod shape-determining protein RodA [Chloroherpetonaceae bacterium]MDW8437384.1 rod shape-determining protein RodA [Chloroherpetonaceae bacterium]